MMAALDPTYYQQGVLISPLGAGHGTSDMIYLCTACGAAVIARVEHTAWHRYLDRALREAT
jgi:hypothetical protein